MKSIFPLATGKASHPMQDSHLSYSTYLTGRRSVILSLLLALSPLLVGCQLPFSTDPAITTNHGQASNLSAPQAPPAANNASQPAAATEAKSPAKVQAVIRGQDTPIPSNSSTTPLAIRKTLTDLPAPGSDLHHRSAMPVSGQYLNGSTPSQQAIPSNLEAPRTSANQVTTTPWYDNSQANEFKSPPQPGNYQVKPATWLAAGSTAQQSRNTTDTPTTITVAQGPVPVVDEVTGQLDPPGIQEEEINTVPLDVELTDTTTGRFMFGVGVNSDAGLTGQIMVNERNFNYRDFPMSLRDLTNGRDFRDGGQGLRIEAMPGNLLQRYMFMFTDPYFIPDPSMSGHDISLNISGFYFDRRYWDWYEQRLGGRVSLGYRITDDLSLSLGLRAEKVTIHNPRVVGVPQLDEVLGDNDLYSGQFTLSHDTRDIPFLPTEGHYIELSLSQAFGSFSYPRADIDLRRHFLLKERADGSGRQTLSIIMDTGFSGSHTPIYERYFAGGFSTIRGFDFRGASPVNGGVTVGGNFKFLTSVEYMFPLTADDMLKGVAFCDFGTVEEEIAMYSNSFRVSPGFGLRVAVPMLGPAPLALDLAFPLNYADTDQIQNFSFFMGLGRG